MIKFLSDRKVADGHQRASRSLRPLGSSARARLALKVGERHQVQSPTGHPISSEEPGK